MMDGCQFNCYDVPRNIFVPFSAPADSLTSFNEWASRIKTHFEPHFWVPEEGAGPYERQADLINRRGIYKDTVGSGIPWADYQFRPNFTIAMVVVSIRLYREIIQDLFFFFGFFRKAFDSRIQC